MPVELTLFVGFAVGWLACAVVYCSAAVVYSFATSKFR